MISPGMRYVRALNWYERACEECPHDSIDHVTRPQGALDDDRGSCCDDLANAREELDAARNAVRAHVTSIVRGETNLP